MFEMALVRIHIKPDLSRLPVYRRAAERYPTDGMIQSLYSLALRMSGQEEEAKRVWDAYQERVAQSEPVPAIPHGLSCPGSTKLGDQSQDSLKRYEELFEQIEEEMRREKSTTERDCEDEGTES
ncbi:hypothetical protein [Chthonomonas calidirosea]|uniref:Uncharacterized protein n=1 Tax=Chthonomonas calidirosea (strain DSM 23976 / ICMP 18418 / T49) TaxID=1303518 RepID=S0EV43_CHTCT|nr:hypothetical protein [Chthonomonas calidirosea]CCW35618.1 hypothetical protein CCALI_01806 [Chthonomonas calidirosea T49]CEK18739.1 hypothetical protein CP488_02286 [Chthonomonas calidirosea]CEK19734.1 hypothetical protein CTKA_02288 [Chthonomonas calidirosea]